MNSGTPQKTWLHQTNEILKSGHVKNRNAIALDACEAMHTLR